MSEDGLRSRFTQLQTPPSSMTKDDGTRMISAEEELMEAIHLGLGRQSEGQLQVMEDSDMKYSLGECQFLKTEAERLSFSHTLAAESEADEEEGQDNHVSEFQWRSVILGTLIGCVMAAQNVYFGLRNGNGFGDGIVAALVGYALIKTGMQCFEMKKFRLQEHVVLQTAATANISTIFTGGFSQYILAMTPQVQTSNNLGRPEDTWEPTYGLCVAWLLLAGFLGFFLSQPFRKKLVIEQDFPWPGPTATAIVCTALHENGHEADKMTRWVGYSTLCSFLWQYFKYVFDRFGNMEKWPIFGAKAAAYTWYADWSPAYIGGGMLMSWKAVWSMALGGLYGYGFILPYVDSMRGLDGWFPEEATGMTGTKAYWYLTSLAVTVTESLYQSIKITILTVKNMQQQRQKSNENPSSEEVISTRSLNQETEPKSRLIPTKLWATGFILNAIVVIIAVPYIFNVKWYFVLPVILYSVPLGYGICLGGAITDHFVISAIGKLTVMLFGAATGDIISVLWLAGVGMITVGSAEHLLLDYRVGHLTGTSPRAMFQAQFFAALVGCFITPLSYKLFISAFEITENGKYTAPGGVGLRALAVLFTDGFNTLPGHVLYFIVPTVFFGLINSLLNDFLPPRYSRYLPNTMAFALGFYVKASYPLNGLIGAGLKWIWTRMHAPSAKKYYSVVAGGLIAGEGLAAVSQAILSIVGVEQPRGMAISFGLPLSK